MVEEIPGQAHSVNLLHEILLLCATKQNDGPQIVGKKQVTTIPVGHFVKFFFYRRSLWRVRIKHQYWFVEITFPRNFTNVTETKKYCYRGKKKQCNTNLYQTVKEIGKKNME